jgi:L-fuconolactonase
VIQIDSHQHFWRYNSNDYVWMTGPLKVLARDFLPDDLRPELDALSFDGTVAVQARQMIEETGFLLELSDRYSWIYGVVGWLDFSAADLEQQLDRFARHPKFRGVRELIHDMPDTDYSTGELHTRAIGMLNEHGLTYDLLLRPPHIEAAIRLVDMYPNQPFVVDHIAKPEIEHGMMEPWLTGLKELARREHVFCKLSGMVTEANWERWSPGDLAPYIDVVLDAFGPRRLMIGSDWPVCTCAGDYRRVMSAAISRVERLSQSEWEMVLGGTCREFYGLNL